MTPASKSRGFTLIELLIVLIIMGLVYSFVGNSIFKKEKSITVTLKNLPEVSRNIGAKPLKFVIYGMDCDKYLWLNGDEPIDIEYPIEIDGKDIKPYRFNYYGELEEYQFLDIFIEEKRESVCLEFNLFENGSNSSYILEDEKSGLFYLFRPYYQPVEIYKSLDNARDNLLREDLNPKTL